MLEQDDDEKYRIYSETGILSILRSMMRNNSLVTCNVGYSDSHILTTVIDVDAEQGEMVLDYGADEIVNQQALKANELDAVAFPDHVKIQFVCEGIEKIQFEGAHFRQCKLRREAEPDGRRRAESRRANSKELASTQWCIH